MTIWYYVIVVVRNTQTAFWSNSSVYCVGGNQLKPSLSSLTYHTVFGWNSGLNSWKNCQNWPKSGGDKISQHRHLLFCPTFKLSSYYGSSCLTMSIRVVTMRNQGKPTITNIIWQLFTNDWFNYLFLCFPECPHFFRSLHPLPMSFGCFCDHLILFSSYFTAQTTVNPWIL